MAAKVFVTIMLLTTLQNAASFECSCAFLQEPQIHSTCDPRSPSLIVLHCQVSITSSISHVRLGWFFKGIERMRFPPLQSQRNITSTIFAGDRQTILNSSIALQGNPNDLIYSGDYQCQLLMGGIRVKTCSTLHIFTENVHSAYNPCIESTIITLATDVLPTSKPTLHATTNSLPTTTSESQAAMTTDDDEELSTTITSSFPTATESITPSTGSNSSSSVLLIVLIGVVSVLFVVVILMSLAITIFCCKRKERSQDYRQKTESQATDDTKPTHQINTSPAYDYAVEQVNSSTNDRNLVVSMTYSSLLPLLGNPAYGVRNNDTEHSSNTFQTSQNLAYGLGNQNNTLTTSHNPAYGLQNKMSS